MRKLLISLLLASAVATPALARPGDDNDRQAASAERQQARAEARAERSERSERSVDVQRPQFNAERHFNGSTDGGQQHQQFVRQQRFEQSGQANAGDNDRRIERVEHVERVRGPRVIDNDSPDSVRVERRQDFEGRQRVVEDSEPRAVHPRMITNDQLRQGDRPLPNVMRTHNRTPMVSDVPRPGTQPPLRVDNHRRHSDVRWSTNWRHDHRYDWRNWRNRHHSWFRLGFYYDPFGWGYSPFSIGWRMWPSYYSSNYWINDPWQYRLPYAPPGTRWVRYFNDAVLVDTWSGEVVDVIYNFFW
jgi:hypothetical protein